MAVVSSSSASSSRHPREPRRRLSAPLFHNKSAQESKSNKNGNEDSQLVTNAKPRSTSAVRSTPSPLSSAQTSPSSSSHSLKSALQTSPSSNMKKSVSFASIFIREHCRDICLNPSVSSGPAVGLGWDFHDHPTGYDVSLFEETRPPRRTRSEFQLPRPVRERLLQDTGISKQELVAAVRAINVAKRQRQHSVATQDTDGAAMAIEWMSGKVKKIVGRKPSYAKEEQRLWTQARVMALERIKAQEAAAVGCA